MIAYLIGYPIANPNRGANRVGANPPTRPDPTRSLGCVSLIHSKTKCVTHDRARLGFGFGASR